MMITHLTLLTLMACGDDTKDDTATGATTETTDEWWDVESDDTGDTTGTTKDDSGKTDTGKDDNYSNITSGIEATIATDLSEGEILFKHAPIGGDSCSIGAALSGFAALKDCADCEFAMSMVVGATAIIQDKGACEDEEAVALLNSEGTVLAFGQETTVLVEYGGVTYYELQQQIDGVWERSGGGYSAVIEDGKELWFFGTK